MPVNKPMQIYESGAINVVRKARDGSGKSRMNRNASSGIEGFAKALEADRSGQPGAGKLTGSALPARQPAPALVRAAGLDPASIVSPHELGKLENLQQLQNMQAIQKAMQQSSQPLAIAGGIEAFDPGILPAMRHSAGIGRSTPEEAAILALRVSSHRSAAQRARQKADGAESAARSDAAVKTASDAAGQALGRLSGMFESGGRGSLAIGYDSTGGTSYGKYQLASKTGSFDAFVEFLSGAAPDLAQKLKGGGPADTGGTGGKMPEIWKSIATAEPERFAALQQSFIERSHFEPAMRRLSERSGLSGEAMSPVLKEVLFSTAVQHGAAAAGRIMDRAVSSVGLERLGAEDPKVARQAEQEVIRQVYDIRATQFGSSTRQVRAAVKSRLDTEMNMALNMLHSGRLA